jgi:S-adenosylmethionine decarboxylase
LAATLIILFSALLGAALVNVSVPRPSWLGRLFPKNRRRHAVAAPPRIVKDSGWQLIHSQDSESFKEWLGHESLGLPFGDGESPSLGSHLLIELFGCDPDSLKLEDTVADAMRSAAVESKATVVADSFHEFKPWGVSGAVIIQESHYTIHTWPEHRYAAVDLFYCGGTVYVDRAVGVLQRRFKPQRIKFLVVRRGVQSEVEG